MTLRGIACALAVAVVSLTAAAQEKAETFQVDAVHSSVLFRIKHLDASWFHGRFNDISGEFTFDPKNPSACRMEVSIDAASIDTNSDGRDKHLRSEEFFDVEKHPRITFTSKKWEATGEKKYKVDGELTLRGVTKPLTVTLDYVGSSDNPRMGLRSGFETTFTIKRSDFGMDAMKGALGDEVRLTVSLEGAKPRTGRQAAGD